MVLPLKKKKHKENNSFKIETIRKNLEKSNTLLNILFHVSLKDFE